jgi:hypothetical protein
VTVRKTTHRLVLDGGIGKGHRALNLIAAARMGGDPR